MKKNLIYTVIFLLCGVLLFGSCQDMLNVDSDRVEYDFESWSPSDSVYSVLGILKTVQGVADRQIILNELRADLISISTTKAIEELQEVYKSDFSNLAANKYLDPKEYYTVINNCNIFLARVDTTLNKNGVYYMMNEYVAVKSIRAWAYLQLAINHNEIPFFTYPITKHSVADEVMNGPKMSRDEVLDKLIADILPYEDPASNPMPSWANSKMFPVIRMLLGEMYLWRGDYKNAAKFFYTQITGAASVHTAEENLFTGRAYVDYNNTVTRRGKASMGTTDVSNGYSSLFSGLPTALTIVTFASNDKYGTVSELTDIFSPAEVGAAQVYASPGIVSLAARQMYCNEIDKEKKEYEYGENYDYQGDLRIKATTYSQMGQDHLQTKYSNIIAKFNMNSLRLDQNLEAMNFHPYSYTSTVVLQRAELAYLRFAEALVGLDSQGYEGAMNIAMAVLKEGLKKNYTIYQNPVYKDSVVLDADGNPVMVRDPKKEEFVPKYETYLAEYQDMLSFEFGSLSLKSFEDNIGFHSRGSGKSEFNKYYALDELCIARYLGCSETNDEGVEVVAPDVTITYQDSLNYMRDLVLDELALEFSWEGYRFGDLVRFAKAMDDNAVLAKRVAGREKENPVSYRNPEFEYDSKLYLDMLNESNWYIPLPAAK